MCEERVNSELFANWIQVVAHEIDFNSSQTSEGLQVFSKALSIEAWSTCGWDLVMCGDTVLLFSYCFGWRCGLVSIDEVKFKYVGKSYATWIGLNVIIIGICNCVLYGLDVLVMLSGCCLCCCVFLLPQLKFAFVFTQKQLNSTLEPYKSMSNPWTRWFFFQNAHQHQLLQRVTTKVTRKERIWTKS